MFMENLLVERVGDDSPEDTDLREMYAPAARGDPSLTNAGFYGDPATLPTAVSARLTLPVAKPEPGRA
jgi:hypothetical protein